MIPIFWGLRKDRRIQYRERGVALYDFRVLSYYLQRSLPVVIRPTRSHRRRMMKLSRRRSLHFWKFYKRCVHKVKCTPYNKKKYVRNTGYTVLLMCVSFTRVPFDRKTIFTTWKWQHKFYFTKSSLKRVLTSSDQNCSFIKRTLFPIYRLQIKYTIFPVQKILKYW